MFEIVESKIPGCVEIIFNKTADKRGCFIKTFHEDIFKKLNIRLELREEYFTVSTKNVFRGLHFQNPPKALDKLVYCVTGKVTDYVVDLRVGSPTFGESVSFELDGDIPKAVFAPVGLAHGFYVKSETAVMQYKVSEVYDAASDTGISYTSFPFSKEIIDPVISDRDQGFVSFADFRSPFQFKL